MPVLRNPRQERFARAYVEACLDPDIKAPLRVAVERAGYSVRANGNANNERVKSPEVRARINELMDEALEYSDLRIQRAAVRLDHIAAASIADFYAADGSFTHPTKMPKHLSDAIKKIEYHPEAMGGGVKHIELHDKVRALQLLMRHLDGGEPNVTHQTLNVTISDEQRIAALIQLLSRVAPEAIPNGGSHEQD